MDPPNIYTMVTPLCVCVLPLNRSVVSSRGRSAQAADAGALTHHGGGEPCQMAEEGRFVISLLNTFTSHALMRSISRKIKQAAHIKINSICPYRTNAYQLVGDPLIYEQGQY